MSATRLDLHEAAQLLDLPPSGVDALVAAGYLTAEGDGSGRTVAITDVKAFAARNPEGSAAMTAIDEMLAEAMLQGDERPEAEALLDAIEANVGMISRRATAVLDPLFGQSPRWTDEWREWIEQQAQERFRVIVALVRNAESTDEGLLDDLVDAGRATAAGGASLPEVLLTLRLSRDLMVQTAVAEAEARGRHWGAALSVVLTRILPVTDRLADAVARGYWQETSNPDGTDAGSEPAG